MELSLLAAKIIAGMYIAIGLGVISGQLDQKRILKSFEDPGISMLAGLFMLVVGGLLVNSHNIWVKDWTVLVTIVAWALLIKGLMYLAYPETMASFAKRFQTKNPYFGVLVSSIGLLFAYFGFMG